MVDQTKEAPTRHWVRWLTLAGSASFITLWVPSCLYDDSKPCGDDLKFDGDVERCVCPEGSVYSPTGCIKCAEHAIVQGTACVCDEGYADPGDGTCQVDMGTSTTSSSTTGGGGEGGEGADGGSTSTTGSAPECTVSDDCDPTEICDAGVCRPPTGWGATCAVDGTECDGLEADFCDPYAHTCTVSNCTSSPKTCPAGFDCCDLSAIPDYAIMCIPAGFCQTPAP